MFSGTSAFNQDISGWDVSSVSTMVSMFNNATSFDQDLSGWNVLNIASEPSFFATGATLFTSEEHPVWGTDGTPVLSGYAAKAYKYPAPLAADPIPYIYRQPWFQPSGWTFYPNEGWGSDQPLTNATSMFREAFTTSNAPIEIETWDVSSVTHMSSMFSGSTAFDRDLSGWDVSSVTDMQFMFGNASAFNQDISGWDLSSATVINGMFRLATAFNQPLNSWNMSNVTNIGNMFEGASSFNQNIGGWDVSNVVSMHDTFEGASSFNQDISAWDVSSVTDMSDMFRDAIAFDQDLTGWNVLNIPSEPSGFAWNAPLFTPGEHPVWGTGGTVPVGAPEYDITTAALWTFSNPLPAGNNEFGKQLSSYGEYTVISDPPFDVADINVNTNDGRVYVRKQTAQGSQAWHTINNPNLDGNSVNDAFGWRVHQTLNYITINTGENNNAGGAVRVINADTGAVILDIVQPTTASYGYSQGMSHLGAQIDPSETVLVVPNTRYDDGTNYGAIEIWDFVAGTKTVDILNPNTDGGDETNPYYGKDGFGNAYALTTDNLYVSAVGEDLSASQRSVGVVYQYDYSGNLVSTLPSPVTTDNFGFGEIMFASDNWLLVGTLFQDQFYVYSISGSTLTFDRVWTDPSFTSLGQNGGIDNNRFSVNTGSEIKVFDIANGTEIVSVPVSGFPKWGTVSNGRLIVVSDGTVRLYGS